MDKISISWEIIEEEYLKLYPPPNLNRSILWIFRNGWQACERYINSLLESEEKRLADKFSEAGGKRKHLHKEIAKQEWLEYCSECYSSGANDYSMDFGDWLNKENNVI